MVKAAMVKSTGPEACEPTRPESCTTVEGAGPANGCSAERPGCTNSGRTKTANGGRAEATAPRDCSETPASCHRGCAEASASADCRTTEASASADCRSTEASASADCRSTETSASADCRSTEASASTHCGSASKAAAATTAKSALR
jgi:hypothetical protein